MSPSDLTWQQLLDKPREHPPIPNGWVSCSSLDKLASCSFFRQLSTSNDATRRGHAIHEIVMGFADMPDDIPIEDKSICEELTRRCDDLNSRYGIEQVECEVSCRDVRLRLSGSMDIRGCKGEFTLIQDIKTGSYEVPSTTLQLDGYGVMAPTEHVGLVILQPGFVPEIRVTTRTECKYRVQNVLQSWSMNTGPHCRFCSMATKCKMLSVELRTPPEDLQSIDDIMEFSDLAYHANELASDLKKECRDRVKAGEKTEKYAISTRTTWSLPESNLRKAIDIAQLSAPQYLTLDSCAKADPLFAPLFVSKTTEFLKRIGKVTKHVQ